MVHGGFRRDACVFWFVVNVHINEHDYMVICLALVIYL